MFSSTSLITAVCIMYRLHHIIISVYLSVTVSGELGPRKSRPPALLEIGLYNWTQLNDRPKYISPTYLT